MAVGDRIMELLQKRGITQKQMAADLSLPLTTLNGYVRNYREPDCATLKLIAAYFAVSCDFLLEYEPRSVEGKDGFFEIYASLSPEQRELLTGQAELMRRQNMRKHG